MDSLSLRPLSPANLAALTALRPVQPLPIQEDKASGSSALAAQDLAQGLFQRALQASILSPVAEPGPANVGLAQEATASLLASLTAPQASVNTTAVPATYTQAAPSTAPSATPPAAVLADTPISQDAFANSSTLDFALQAALRFGAGVVGQSSPALATADLSTGLIRDAATVQRLGNLQAQTEAPGPEAFTLPQAAMARVLRSYEAAPVPAIRTEASTVDVFA